MRRDTWHRYAHIPTPIYLLSLIVAMPWIRHSSDPKWILVHLLLLGAITNLIFVWSSHFTFTMLRLPADSDRKPYLIRVIFLNVGVVLIIMGKIQEFKFLMAVGAVLVVISASLHAQSLFRHMSKALPSRFKRIPRFYIVSALFLVLGGTLGGFLSQGLKGETKYQLLFAHYSANIFGWIGITVAGTLITLIPTMLRTQLPELAEKRGYKSFPWLILSTLIMMLGALSDRRMLSAGAVVLYMGAWLYLLSPHFPLLLKRKNPFSILSTFSSNAWLLVSMVSLAIDLTTETSWKIINHHAESLIFMLGIGFALQIGLGALSYLITVVLGGGPENARKNVAVSERFKSFRLISLNAGLAFLIIDPSRSIFLLGGLLIGLSLVVNLLLLGSLRPAKRS
ncbi:MAG: hypothetical protein D4R83_08015 [Streptomycetaceae bacterium]|nr:MAG: hypothetical protein D4R83_08015 [Streptomycetaceae bacterium]